MLLTLPLWVILLSIGSNDVLCNDNWRGATYWNSRYSAQGINYDTGDMFWGLWSNDGNIREHYYLSTSEYGHRICNGGCNCNEDDKIVTGCSGSTVKLQGYTFDNITMDTFSSSVQDITVMQTTSFSYFGNVTFNHLTNLRKLTIHKTDLYQFPEISTTVLERMMLADNKIKFFANNHTNPIWPTGLKRVSLIQNEIEWVPDGLFSGSNVEYLSLSRNLIRYVPNRALENANKLIFLSIDDNAIEYISKTHLSSLGSSDLQHLNLSNNQIKYIQPGALSQLTKLKILELHNNQMSTIARGTFDNIPSLIHLDLTKNKLKILTAYSFTNMVSLITLRLHSQVDKMTSIYYDAFHNINGNLTNLWISDNALTSFPHQLLAEQQYYKLKEVYADHNSITDPVAYTSDGFPPHMEHVYLAKSSKFVVWDTIKYITKLWLGANNIGSIRSTDFCNLIVLGQLQLSANSLEDHTFPNDALDCLSVLWYLDLSSNNFDYVPDAVSAINLPKLTQLLLSSNRITAIEAGTFSSHILTNLYLNGNRILVVENNTFPETLVELYMGSNLFRFTHENPFSNLTNLRRLELQNNKIDYIPDSAFENCTALNVILLNGNNIGWLKNVMFKDISFNWRYTVSNNDLAYIEDGTLANISSIQYIELNNNKLTKLPNGGDFSDLSVRYLLLYSNRITEIEPDTFKNLVVTETLSLQNNQISVIKSNAFNGVTVTKNIYMENNPLKTLSTNSFVNVACEQLYINGMQISHLPTDSFVGVSTKNIYLQDNNIDYIDIGAFDGVHISENIRLDNNGITTLRGSIFSNNSTVSSGLYLNKNSLTSLPPTAFDGIVSLNTIYLNDNSLFEYPAEALGSRNIRTIDVSNNNITELPLTSFLNHGTVQTLTMTNNQLTSVAAGLLDPLTSLKNLDMSNNNIGFIEPNAFTSLTSLETMTLANNQLYFFPKLPNMTNLKSLDLSNNSLKSFEINAFDEIKNNKKFKKLTLTANDQIGCDCYVYEALEAVSGKITGGTCGSPASSAGIMFSKANKTSPMYFLNVDSSIFLCSPVNVQTSSLTTNYLTVTWDRPNKTIPAESYISNANAASWEYRVTCTDSVTGVGYQAITSSFSYAFTYYLGIVADREYVCTVALKLNNSISAESQPSVIKTPVVPVAPNGTVAVVDWVLPVTHYDFSLSHSDFSGFESTVTNSPDYVPSPYGAWLMRTTNPSTDSFSSWYVDNPGTNYAFSSTIVLSTIVLSPPTHRYVSNGYFPVDGMGFGDQDKDCYGSSHNFGFTTAIRSGFVYQGSEVIAIGGGDDMWLYLNGVLVMEVITRDKGQLIPCKRIDISAASTAGGAVLTPEEGYVVNSQCITTRQVTTEQITLELEVNERYHFSIFHAERLQCASSLFIETKNFQFITNPADEQPRDYVVSIDEDFHNDGIVQEVVLTDIFSVGPPIQVSVISGNEARHFTIKDNTAANQAAGVAPAPVVHTYTNIDGLSFVECATPSTITPEGYDPSVEVFTVNTEIALLTLDTSLDYEVNQLYTVTLQVVDTLRSPQATGTITVKIKIKDVNDNCPELTQTLYHLLAVPSLQISPMAHFNSSDIDSGVNSEMTFSLSSITISPELETNTSVALYDVIYAANSTLSFVAIVTDGGTPKRGAIANVSVELDNSCLVDVEHKPINYSISVNSSTGELYLRVPGYYYYDYGCREAVGIQSGIIYDALLTVSSAIRDSSAGRSRLNMTALPASLDSLTGGWVAAIDDVNQWIQVDMETEHRIHIVQLQGRDEEANWVTSFSISYSSDGANWNTYQNSSGYNIFDGTFDQNTIVNISLVPEVIARYIRINPQTWVGHVSLRFELIGCSQSKYDFYRTTCQRCLTTWYCPGDSTMLPCGRCEPKQAGSTCGRSKTEHSFGAASECTTCPLGWICENGYASPCPDFHYVECNDTYCPQNCTQCEIGYACRGGQRYLCLPGTFSDGNSEFCEMCSPGKYQDQSGQGTCKNCPAGYYSSSMKDRCNVCDSSSWAADDGTGCKTCTSASDCPCLYSSNLCFTKGQCYNYQAGGINTYGCLDCPTGYTGSGVTCTDVNECVEYKPCWNYSACINTEPGFQCRRCPYGYLGTFEDGLSQNVSRRTFQLYNNVLDSVQYQTCVDVDECLISNGGCDANSYCYNTIGSYNCGFCKEGYYGNAKTGCYLSDFCLSGVHNCDSHATCIYTGPQKFRCECNTGWAGDGYICGEDIDKDGIPTLGISCTEPTCKRDNCPNEPNSGQEDNDGDWLGDPCDDDDDGDTINDEKDNCQYIYNLDQADADSDGVGDVCDNCVNHVNSDQSDVDGDGIGDACDSDIDGDGHNNATDNCPYVSNPGQADSDGDNVGDDCDNCPTISNAAQTDTNLNGIGDDCDTDDLDGDSKKDSDDNCPTIANAQQTDADGDGIGDACDDDIDGDGVNNDGDNCAYVANPTQTDVDGNYRGDICENDFDLDGVLDRYDNCPQNKFITNTSFSTYVSLDLNPEWTTELAANWLITDDGQEVRQLSTTLKPVALIGNQPFDHVTFSGTTYAKDTECSGYIGFIFGYQSTKRYYLAIWRHKYLNMDGNGGTKGVQLRLIDSSTTPSTTYAEALYHSYDVNSYTKLLWQDPNMIGWECRKSYRWFIYQSPSIGLMRIVVKQSETILVDSGYIYDITIHGGRLGVFSYNQTGSVWSDLKTECTNRLNYALSLTGSSYGVIGNISSLGIEKSFTIDVWVYLASGYQLTNQPILCSNDSTLCFYMDNGILRTQVGSIILNGTTTIPVANWTHVLTRYNAQEGTLTMYVNGVKSGKYAEVTNVPEITWDGSQTLYIGKNQQGFFNGYLDELRVYSVQVPDSEIDDLWQKVGMDREYSKLTLAVHYSMDNNTSSLTTLLDQGPLRLDAKLYGSPKFVESSVDYSRFYLKYN